MTGNVFNFSGLGKHSNNKYKYFLSINRFDNIEAQLSSWSAASVGKLSVTLRKRWARKWPRLLGDKKTKVNNMHLWMEMQEKLDGSLSGFSSVSNSPVTFLQVSVATHYSLPPTPARSRKIVLNALARQKPTRRLTSVQANPPKRHP